MTDGIGVGLQSDGAGNWNLATLSGTTVTEGADSGLDDDDVARIEIEKDLSGAYWYYIYDASGTKPTTATGKLFTTLSEGYTGWYANGAGATTQTYAIDNISIRAESIVGRTNVEVTEPFWFRDEFGEDSVGRYQTYFIVSDGVIATDTIPSSSSAGVFCHNWKIRDGNYSFEWTPIANDVQGSCDGMASLSTTPHYQNNISGNGYIFRYQGTNLTCSRKDSGTATYLTKVVSGSLNVVLGTPYVVDVIHNSTGTENIKVFTYEKGTARPSTPTSSWTDTTYTDVYLGFGIYTNDGGGVIQVSFDNLQISGTRVYQKPIHRGAMLETYHDGTQEVVGTAFIDDCQWDRSAEYNAVGVSTIDTTNGYLDIAEQYGGIYTKNQFGDFYLSTDVYTSAATVGWQIMFGSDVGSSFSIAEGNKYDLYFNHQSSEIRLSKIVSGVHTTVRTVSESSIGVWRKVGILKNGSSIKTWVDGVLVIDIIDSTFTSGYIGFGSYAPHTGNVRFKNMQIIGLDSDATNGIAACIPPIGGGARYGVQEGASIEFTNKALRGDYDFTTCVKTTVPSAIAHNEMYFGNTTDTSAITEDTTTTKDLLIESASYLDFEKPLVLNYDDREDTISVGVRKLTDNDPTTYIDFMAVVPTKEVI